MFSRMPRAFLRSKSRARLASTKWKCEPTWIGRSPEFLTASRTIGRPELISIVPSSSKYCPGTMLSDGVMDRDQLRAVGKRTLDLDFANHLRHAVHDRVSGQNRRPQAHDLGHRVAIPDHLEDF